jgi:raffinose/stachyose/melibiose transport system substrate-binding protein
MKKVRILSMVTIIAFSMVMVLAGCGSSNTNNETTTTAAGTTVQATTGTTAEAATPVEAPKPVTLTALTQNDYNTAGMQKVIKDYEAKTGNKIDLQISATGQPYNDALSVKALSNDMPDLVFTYASKTNLVSILKAETTLLDLSNEDFIKKIDPSVLNTEEWLRGDDGKIRVIPSGGVSTACVTYNKKIFADNGIEIPKTYDEFLAVCEKLKQKGIQPLTGGAKDGWPPLFFEFIGFANEVQKNPDLVKQINENKIDLSKSPEIAKVISRQIELAQKGYYPKNNASTDFNAVVSSFGTGKAAMAIQHDGVVTSVIQAYPDMAANIGEFPLPWDTAADTIIPIDMSKGIGIGANSKNVDAAKGFLQYFTQDDVLTEYFTSEGTVPSYTNLTSKLGPGIADMAEILKNGHGKIFVQYIFTAGLNPFYNVTAAATNGKSLEAIQKELQDQFIKSGKDNKVAGF